METSIYRSAERSDIAALAGIRAANWGTEEKWVQTITRYLDCEHHPQKALLPRALFVAEADGVIAGFIAGHLTERYGCEGELQWIDVVPEHRRTGIASELLRILAGWFAEKHALRICVNVDAENIAARSFYRKFGAETLNAHWLVWEDISAGLGR